MVNPRGVGNSEPEGVSVPGAGEEGVGEGEGSLVTGRECFTRKESAGPR